MKTVALAVALLVGASVDAKPKRAITVPEGVRPVVAPIDAPAQFVAFLEKNGRKPAELACDSLWLKTALLCFRVREGTSRRWATTDDLIQWKMTISDLRSLMVGRGVVPLSMAAKVIPIEGMDAKTVQFSDREGWTAVAVADPRMLEDILGGLPVLAAVPTTDVVVAWRPDDEQVNKAVAVSVYEAWEAGPNPVTPEVFMWTGQHWLPYLEARPQSPGAPSAPGQPAQ